MCSPEKYADLYCLSFNPSLNKQEREQSWDFLDVMEDYRHMGLPNNLWVTTAANSEYRVSVLRNAGMFTCSEVECGSEKAVVIAETERDSGKSCR